MTMTPARVSAVQNLESASVPPQYPIESVDNALKLILLLGDQQQLRLTDASAHLGVASSTAHRLLAMLSWRGFVRQDPVTKLYGPGPALTNVAFSVLRSMDIPRVAQPILEDLSIELGETCHLGTLEGDRVRFLAVAEPDVAVRVAPRLGKSLPAHCTSTGKALLSEFSNEQIKRLYPAEQLEVVTPNSIGTRTELLEVLVKTRHDGYAVNRQESENGVASVAVPIHVASGIRLAINASAPVQRLPARKVPAFGRALQEAAFQLSGLIG